MTKPLEYKWIQIKINVCDACLIEDTHVFELPINKLEAIIEIIESYNSNVGKEV